MSRRPWWARGTRFWVLWSLGWVAWGVVWLVAFNSPGWLEALVVPAMGLNLFVAGWRVFIINPRLERTFGPEGRK